ncbi:MAG: hypothetical protein IID46_10350 [Planctomycetes bacterium]|nr:hypothetical protein [Planctomycetota bacterium]
MRAGRSNRCDSDIGIVAGRFRTSPISQITDDTESRQKNTPSLESLKKRSAATRWKSIKDSSKSNLWKSVPSTVKKSSETLSEDQRIFEEPKPMLPDQSIVDAPQNASSRSDVDPTKEQPLPVFNLTEDPVRRQETFTLPNKLQKPQPAPYSELRVSEEPDSAPVPSIFNFPSVPAASKFQPPIIRLDPTIRVDARTEETFRLQRRTAQAPNRSSSKTQDNTPTPLQKITEISPFADYVPKGYELDADGQMPEIELLDQTPYKERSFDEIVYTWEPTNLSYNPLYFEDAPLERYGHTHHPLLQPFVSATRFGVQLVGLPYQMTIDPIYKKRYPLGYYRPGEYAPKKLYQIPLNLDAAIVEAGAVTGMFFLIP